MPAGCEFICKNQACNQFDSGFVMTSTWPMGRIELVLNSPLVKKDQVLRDKLIEFKNQGRKFACISFPNLSRIETISYRVHMWSEKANCIWKYDAEIKNPQETIEETVKNANIPSRCPTTDCILWDFSETIKNGILCPHCGIKLQQSRWFTNGD